MSRKGAAEATGNLVILDRDGVINRDSAEFIKSPEEWHPLQGSLEAIATLTQNGFTVAVASNQSGVGRGLLDHPTLQAIHEKMRRAVSDAGGAIDRIVYCPHRPEAGCACRKPLPGLLESLAKHYGISLTGVPVIGDSRRDVEAARAAGARPLLVLTGNGETARHELGGSEPGLEIYRDLREAARALVSGRAKERDET